MSFLASVVVVLVLVVPGALPGTSRGAVALAGSTAYLCTGYAGCQDAGYSNAGYRRASSSRYWQMYAGHNCTNYVAYRMVKSGLPNTRPWEGSGNASNWGVAMASITDQTPRVGAVAWWKAGVPPAGSSGHLAYVEEVISSTEILVSEDYWGGDFHWRRITKTGTGWPSGFVHFNDVGLKAAAAPAVNGTPTVGQPLEVLPGTWTPAPTSLDYRWLADGVPIMGAIAATYTPTPDTRGKALTIQVTARRNGFAPGSTTTSTAPVARGTFIATAPPTIEGSAEVDQMLSLRAGTWSPEPAASTVQWYADGAEVPGAVGTTFLVGQEQVDKRITASVSATARGYRKAAATTVATAPVIAGTIAVAKPLAVRGRPRYGTTMSVRPATLQPADATISYTWMRNGEPMRTATGPTYTVRGNDIGRTISVRADYTRRSYRSASEVVEVAGIVTTPPRVRVRATGKRALAVIAVRVSAPHVPEPSGALIVRVGSRTLTTRLVNGRSRLVVRNLHAGTRRVVVRYAGTAVIGAAVVRTTTDILPSRSRG